MKLIQVEQELCQRLDELRNSGDYCSIIGAITSISDYKLDYDLVTRLAEAYLRTYKYREAIDCLLSVSDKGAEDYMWHFILGQAYYFTNDMTKVNEEIGKAFELNPEGDYASDFVEFCHIYHYVKLHLESLSERLVPRNKLIPEHQFSDRVSSFWKWFCDNEAKLSEFSENNVCDSEVTAFFSEGTNLITKDIKCFVEKGFKFTFVLNGSSPLYYLLPYLISRAPKNIQNKWDIGISIPKLNRCNDLSVNGIPIKNVKISFNYESESDKFNLYFYSEEFQSIEESEASIIVVDMLKLLFSENLLRLYIDTLSLLRSPTDEMFPMEQMCEKMSNVLKLSGKEMIENPSDIRVAYAFGNEYTDKLRHDTLSGLTSLLNSVAEYISDVNNTYMDMENCGAKLVYLFYTWPMEMDEDKIFNLRYNFEYYLIDEILGEKGSGREIGIALGSASGSMYEYEDLLIYDMSEFFKRIDRMLKDYQFEFHLAEFCPDGNIVNLRSEMRL
ncbi:tetratricopeptide repeat protein [Candidatus Methanomassiliicoccus intestinalis]|uniref:Uncharacterized protein n=1 Tax=Methanomassiliicoccus intestinalis (strain Issoire-Mx1) TaxID=1295009 RepID=R9T7H9_METII|nr:hypothetical protein [Candidatus Methanomassiliicoccus intestinalis]AGN26609.1 hypothetical protein MMINT_12800 [Candidatus Methanomassiliicoccus intestinalis Issoire-Mx1]